LGKQEFSTDINYQGDSFSRHAYISVKKIEGLLEGINKSLHNKDFDAMSHLVKYPFSIIMENGVRFRIDNEKDFKEMFFNKGYSEALRKVFSCVKIKNISIDRSYGPYFAFGDIWFFVENNEIKLYVVSKRVDVINKWMDRYCS